MVVVVVVVVCRSRQQQNVDVKVAYCKHSVVQCIVVVTFETSANVLCKQSVDITNNATEYVAV